MRKGPFDSGMWREEGLLPKEEKLRTVRGNRVGNRKKVRKEHCASFLCFQTGYNSDPPCPCNPVEKT